MLNRNTLQVRRLAPRPHKSLVLTFGHESSVLASRLHERHALLTRVDTIACATCRCEQAVGIIEQAREVDEAHVLVSRAVDAGTRHVRNARRGDIAAEPAPQ